MEEREVEKLLYDWIKSGDRERFSLGLIYACAKVLQLEALQTKGGESGYYIPDIKTYLEGKGYEP